MSENTQITIDNLSFEDGQTLSAEPLNIMVDAIKQSLASSANCTIPTITIGILQVTGAGKGGYTNSEYIRFQPTAEQKIILENENFSTIKLDLSALGENAPAQYVWIKRNTKVTIQNLTAYQFTVGGEQFWYEDYAKTAITIKNIGNAAMVYVPDLGGFSICDISFASISIQDLYYALGQLEVLAGTVTTKVNTILDLEEGEQ
jgi:hypothetical protein